MRTRIVIIISLLLFLVPFAGNAQETERPVAEKILFIGDSMTGWLAERLEAYGKQNGFEVSTVVWDGSTLKKWGTNPKLSTIVREQNPDAVFVSLGMNDLFEQNPGARCMSSLEGIKEAAGDAEIIWVGPPSWPGKGSGKVLNEWLAEQLGEGHYFNSSNLELQRQSSSNPHPTRQSISKWMDNVVSWLETDGAIALPGYEKPTGEQMARGKYYVYKRMKETL